MKNRLPVFVVAFLFLSLVFACKTTNGETPTASTTDQHVDYLTMAWDALNVQKDNAKALELFELADNNGADKRQVLQGRIWAYNGLGDTEKARENGRSLYDALVHNSIDPSFNYGYAADALRWGSKMPDEAMEVYGIQIARDKDIHSLANRGTLYKERGETDKAKTDLAAAYVLAKKANGQDAAQIETALAEVSLAAHDGQFGIINGKPVQMSALYDEYIDLASAKESAGSNQNGERDSVALFRNIVDNFDKLSQKTRVALKDAMKAHAEYAVSDDLAFIDALGSKLSSVGLHPYSERKLYYFPNGSGDKAACKKIEFYPSGMPKWLKLEVPLRDSDNRAMLFTIPSQREKVRINVYSEEYLSEKLRGSRDTKGIYPEANEAEFWETGSLRRLGNFAYAEVELPAKYGSARDPAPTHCIVWTKEGTVYQLIQAGDGNAYTLSDNMRIGYFYDITWMNTPECKIAIGLENAIAVDLFFKKGTYALYKEDPKSKELVSFSKTFDKDTTVKIIGGFWVNDKGDITRYWGEMK